MVAIGSGGVFNGVTYTRDDGKLCTGQDYILDKLPLAKGWHYITLFWMQPHGLNSGFACQRPGAGKKGGVPTV